MFERDIQLSQFTSIGLGGPAKYFFRAVSLEELVEAVRVSREMKIRHFIIGGGSNVVFSDEGFDGLVIKNEIMGISSHESKDHVIVSASSGEDWDKLVNRCVSMNLSGIECLSGIPGTVGATPVQNVGAYGQEVKDTIAKVYAVDLNTHESVVFNNRQCKFSYRSSRFKEEDKGKYFIYRIDYKLSKRSEPDVKYEELNKALLRKSPYYPDLNRSEKIRKIRKTVLEIRRKKSMILDEKDPDSRSCGSFFMNPIVSLRRFERIRDENFPEMLEANYHHIGTTVKIPAAWLVENAGFSKGFEMNGAAISSKHSLALVNKGTTSSNLVNLSEKIVEKVRQEFGICLKYEPEVLGN